MFCSEWRPGPPGVWGRADLWLAFPAGREKQLWLGSDMAGQLCWRRALGWLLLSPYPISPYSTGHSRSQGQGLLPLQLWSFSWPTRKLCPEPLKPYRHAWHEGGQGRGELEKLSGGVHPHPHTPSSCGLWIPFEHSKAQMSERSCAIRGDGQLFQELIKIRKEWGKGLRTPLWSPLGSIVPQPAFCSQSPEYPAAAGGRRQTSFL